jgi:secreted PhoX family phosphatase
MTISRRSVLAGGAAGVGLAIAGHVPASARTASAVPGRAPRHSPRTHRAAVPFPALVDDPRGVLALPPGFRYRIVSRTGETTLAGGLGATPGAPDGTAVFAAGRDRLRLVQNHELTAYESEFGVPHVPGTVYDPGASHAGGCTVIETDRDGRRKAEWVGISGTTDNCAGGPTPWGTWMTCEETELRAGTPWSAGGRSGTYQKDHGYVFEVFPHRGDQAPAPIKAFGRFAHEALAVDNSGERVYLSEDASGPNGLFYRWTAPRGLRLRAGVAEQLAPTAGTLEAMQILLDDGSVLPDVAYVTSAQLGRPFPVRWVPVADRDAKAVSVRKQFADGTVTRGKKFEGVYSNGRGAYVVNSYAFNSSDLPADAARHDGMVWFYDYAAQTIQLVTYFPHRTRPLPAHRPASTGSPSTAPTT